MPRIARDLGVWVPRTRRCRCCERSSTRGRKTSATASRASRRGSSSWSTTSAPRACARRSSAGSARAPRLHPRASRRRTGDHIGVEIEHEGLRSIGVPVHLGLMSGDQMVALADLAATPGRDLRVTRQQNIVVTGIADVERRLGHACRDRLPGRREPPRSSAIGCTGEPHCNFAVAETKGRLGTPDRASRGAVRQRRLRAAPAPRRLPPRVRPALGRRPRLPGHDGSGRRGQAPPGLRRPAARRARAGGGDRLAGVPACPERGAQRNRRGPDRAGSSAPPGRVSAPSVTAQPTTSSATFGRSRPTRRGARTSRRRQNEHESRAARRARGRRALGRVRGAGAVDCSSGRSSASAAASRSRRPSRKATSR